MTTLLVAIFLLSALCGFQAFLIYKITVDASYERATILQRIQDPAGAISLHAAERMTALEQDEPVDYTIPLSDDKAFADYEASLNKAAESYE